MNKNAAVMMVAFAVVGVPVAMVAIAYRLDVLSLLGGAGYLNAFTADQVNANVMRSLDSYNNAILVATVFWGLWLLPFGYLVFKSGFLPRILGLLLMLGCFGDLMEVFGAILVPGYGQTPISDFVSTASGLGEIGICLWLLIMGAGQGAPDISQH